MDSFPETHHFINGRLTSGPERRRGSLIPYSRTFFTSIPHPELLKSPPRIPLFSQYPIPYQDFGESRLSSSGRISYPVKNFFVFPNLALCFGQISDPEGRYPSRPFDLMFAALLFAFYVSDSNISRGPQFKAVIFSLFFSFVI